MTDDTVFRISGDPTVSISKAEVEAQVAARAKLDERLLQDGKLAHLKNGDALLKEHDKSSRYRRAGRRAEDVRAGLNPNIRMPTDESIQAAMDAGDMETAHLMRLQQIRPGTPEFMAERVPPAEEIIEVIGPKGAEGFGIVQRQYGVGPRAGEVIT